VLKVNFIVLLWSFSLRLCGKYFDFMAGAGAGIEEISRKGAKAQRMQAQFQRRQR
jgi:hypothetical protein